MGQTPTLGGGKLNFSCKSATNQGHGCEANIEAWKALNAETEEEMKIEKKRICYFEFLLTGPAGRAINNLVQYLTWDQIPGGGILARFDAERASFPKPLSPSVLQFLFSP